jgi:hypothetical protein
MLKDSNAVLWLVLVDGNKEERQRVISTKHKYVFGEEGEDKSKNNSKVVNIINHYHKEVKMSQYNIHGGNQGAVGDNAKAENFTQTDNRKVVLTTKLPVQRCSRR